MHVRIWGCRGSIPVATNSTQIKHKLKEALKAADGKDLSSDDKIDTFIDEELPWPISHSYGGNSSCVELGMETDSHFLCDLGSGLREYGIDKLKEFGPANGQTYNIFLSHLHWDHVMGFPFFTPAYIPGNTIRIHACHNDPESALKIQQSSPGFPVTMDMMGAKFEFVKMKPNTPIEVDGVKVTAVKQYHGGDSYGYRFEKDDKAIVYSTDSEHKQENADEMQIFVDLFSKADAVIFDAQYSLAESQTLKEDWGHSSNIIGVELCHEAQAKHLILYHHEPAFDDEQLHQIFQETVRYEEIMRMDEPLKVSSAYDGMIVEV